MADQGPLVSLSAARERTINDLSTAFASDDLSMEELEARIERAYKATTLDEIHAVTADLRASVTPGGSAPAPAASPTGAVIVPQSVALVHDRISAVMSNTERQGLWAVPQQLDVYALMSNTMLDLSRATLPEGIIEIHVRATMASLMIILPPGIRVASRLTNIMSSVTTDDALDHTPATAGAPVIRLKGWAMMSNVETVVRRRE